MRIVQWMFALNALLISCNGHGVMINPVSRNELAHRQGKEYCEHCLNGGTVPVVREKDINKNNWALNYPPTDNEEIRHGLCGSASNDYMKGGALYEEPQSLTEYPSGGTMEITIDVRTHHHGWFEFRLCNADVHGLPVTQACFNEHLLLRDPNDESESPIDPNFPGRYYMIPKCAPNANMQTFKVKLPEGLSCERCVVQWWWVTANSCHGGGYTGVNFPDTYQDCIGDGGVEGWLPRPDSECGEGTGYPEEFWNCADIAIRASSGDTTSPTNAPTTKAPSSITTPLPSVKPSAAPSKSPTNSPMVGCDHQIEAGQDCSSTPSCCPNGQMCYRKNQWWAGCLESCTPGMIDSYDDLPWACTVVSDGGSDGNDPGSGSTTECTAFPDTVNANATNFVLQHGKLRLDGVQLVDEHGTPVQLMGMSSHGLHWFSQCYSKQSLRYMVENWGITVFRAAMYVGEGGYGTNPSLNKGYVDDVVEWCTELGIYVIIDFHVLNPGDPNVYLQGADGGIATQFWREIATQYKSYTNVLYEVANEPNGVTWDRVLEYHNKIIPVIRAVDPETIIIAGTSTWSQDIQLAAATPVNDPYHVMYTFHFYAGTHMFLLSRIQEYMTKIPIFVSEWGTSEASGTGGPYLDNTMIFLENFNGENGGITLSWAQWSYCDKSEVSAALNPGSCSNSNWDSTSCSGTFVKSYIKHYATSNPPVTRPPTASKAPTHSPTTSPTSLKPTAAPTSTSRPTRKPTMAPTTTLKPTVSPTSRPTTTAPTSAPTQGSCANAWYAQCGGIGFSGQTCCQEGLLCVYSNPYYSQCLADPKRQCLLENEGCTNNINGCCGSLRCDGDQYYKWCQQ